MEERFSRIEQLLGQDALEILRCSHVAVFGVGGVGGYVVEGLARSGVGRLTLVDGDTIAESNLNRQIIALTSTLGRPKVEAAKARCLDIDPGIAVEACCCLYLPETANRFDFARYDYIVDAIDTVSGKVELAVRAQQCGVPIISCMGAGNKLDPTRLQVADIYQTSICPLARAVRSRLRSRGVKSLKVVYSTEPPVSAIPRTDGIPASAVFVPGAAGLILAAEVVRDLIARE